ncbi:MAG TPA: glycyl-radical enzyme activating protein [Mobilitalea sp.]|nr:glycyl-radical enzyme activating protein [Mobilitalea sp.]
MEKKPVTGRIFDIQRFSIHDGPGIRTIIFLKGCRLRCKWCCNPESQEYDIQTMTMQGKPKVIGRDVTVDEVMEEIKKDLPYYRRSGGGITLSGGEALLQPEFAVELLRTCQEFGINTAIESAGYASFEVIQKYLPYIDYYLMDIKHMNSKKHEEFTGKPNELILENARKIAESGANLIIRVPVIPTFNHTKEEIRAIAAFAKTLPDVKELHLLPYHRLGQDKYEGLGRTYTLSHIEPLDNEYMNGLLEVAKLSGLPCQIGG